MTIEITEPTNPRDRKKELFDRWVFGTTEDPSGDTYVKWSTYRMVVSWQEYKEFDPKLCTWLKKCATQPLVVTRDQRGSEVVYRFFAKRGGDLAMLRMRFG